MWEGKVLSAMQVHGFVLSDLCDILQVHFKDMGVGRYSWPTLSKLLVGWKKAAKGKLVSGFLWLRHF